MELLSYRITHQVWTFGETTLSAPFSPFVYSPLRAVHFAPRSMVYQA